MSYQNIIIAISDAFQCEHLQDAGVAVPANDTIAAEIIGAQRSMPDYLRLPMYLMTWYFDMSGLVRSGRRFQSLDQEQKLGCINAWRNSRIGTLRSFVRFYESLFLLIALQEDIH
ncbi:MAG: hypothetical protein QF790_09655 [Gammaproteobacteria bacterium]|jgi:hypothetical protein|nr:hypothetical protein [Gammaproteobacteria bacterium]MDP6617415.1 hypothetical protein [Gammaproteobacteria bacterium]MDP6694662.1 hypothetical protein [Gammaproteobacteria bacterium]